ncbi:MAG TPA: EAL domain-containing protein [Symbiobacteriaceae bacterium]|jgi:diguanylate cyclase (GGDEF)-like protein/PAS domain S-box-containing protein
MNLAAEFYFVLDADMRFRSIAGSLLQRMGLAPDDCLGNTVQEVLGPCAARSWASQCAKAYAGDRVAFAWAAAVGEGRCQVQTVLTPVGESATAGIAGIGWVMPTTRAGDESARSRRQEAMDAVLREIDDHILKNDNLDGLLATITDKLTRICASPLVWIGFRQPDGSVQPVAKSGTASAYLDGNSIRWDEGPWGQGPVGYAVRTGEVRVADTVLDPELAPWLDRTQAYGLSYIAVIPLRVEDRILGNLSVYGAASRPFDTATLADLTRFATQVSISLLTMQHLEQIRLQSAALQAADNAVLIADAAGRVKWVNAAYTRLTGYEAHEVLGQPPRFCTSGLYPAAFFQAIQEAILAGHTWQGEITNQRKDGQVYFEQLTITPVRDEQGNVAHFVVVKQDITQRRQQQDQIAFLSTHDQLTGLTNRRGLLDVLQGLVRQGGGGSPSSLLMIGLDNFKLINDSIGHAAGDYVLVSVARFLLAEVGQGRVVARIGSDEFGILLQETAPGRAREIAEALRREFDGKRWTWDGHTFPLTVSIGLTTMEGEVSAEEAMVLVDSALRDAKTLGRNRVVARCFCDRDDAVTEAARCIAQIKDAIQTDRMVVLFQPVVDLRANEYHSHVEALVRMQLPDGRVVPPGSFIPTAERFGIMPEIDRCVIKKVLATLAEFPGWRVFVNLSGLTLSDDAIVDFIREAVQCAGVRYDRICFEVTETAALMGIERVQRRMRELRDLGCRFALDDFGSGFSSFAYLRALPVDYVKLDGYFTCDLDTDHRQRALTKAVVDIAHILNKEVVAEQVERRIDAEILKQLGVAYGQGYLWARPGPLMSYQGRLDRSAAD